MKEKEITTEMLNNFAIEHAINIFDMLKNDNLKRLTMEDRILLAINHALKTGFVYCKTLQKEGFNIDNVNIDEL
jgi:hypothetical protein